MPGTLYAAYRLAEVLGVRFYLHGDVIPDEPMEWKLPDAGRARGAAVCVARHPALPRLSRKGPTGGTATITWRSSGSCRSCA